MQAAKRDSHLHGVEAQYELTPRHAFPPRDTTYALDRKREELNSQELKNGRGHAVMQIYVFMCGLASRRNRVV